MRNQLTHKPSELHNILSVKTRAEKMRDLIYAYGLTNLYPRNIDYDLIPEWIYKLSELIDEGDGGMIDWYVREITQKLTGKTKSQEIALNKRFEEIAGKAPAF